MFTAAFVLMHFAYFTPCGHSLNFLPKLASNGSSLCAVDDPSYLMNTDDIIGIPPGVPGSVKCSFYCTRMSSTTNCSGFNYLVCGPTSGTCQFYSQPPTTCTAMNKGCTYYEVSNTNQPTTSQSRPKVSVCSGSPCLNNGTCVEIASGYNCSCVWGLTGNITGYEGTRCEIIVSSIINLPAIYNYVRVSGVQLTNKSAVLVYGKLSNDLNVGFTAAPDTYTANTMYEILISGWSNTESVIRKAKQGTNLVTVATTGYLSATSYRAFWITWKNGTITVGQNTTIGSRAFMSYIDTTPSAVNYLALTAWNQVTGSAFVKILP